MQGTGDWLFNARAGKVDRKPIAAFVGIDWADKKHDIVLCAAAGNAQVDHRRIDSQPEALIEWASDDEATRKLALT